MQRREMLGTVMGALGAVGVMGAGMGDARAATQWKLATGYKPETLHTQNIEQFARDVEKATAGDLKIAVHPNNSLVKLPEILGAVQSGKAEAGEGEDDVAAITLENLVAQAGPSAREVAHRLDHQGGACQRTDQDGGQQRLAEPAPREHRGEQER